MIRMLKYFLRYSALISLILLSCNPSNSSSGSDNIPTSEDKIFPLTIQKGGNTMPLEQIRAQARTLIDHRIQTGTEALSMLTSGFWWPEYVFNKGSISAQGHYDGYWLDFKEDFSYEYGKYSTRYGGGKYHYSLDNSYLIMLDNDVALEPKVWQANYNGQAIALVGRHEYGINNGMQIKLVPLDVLPSE